MVVLSATCIICSIILIVGLFKDNRFLLLPWTVAVAMTTLIDVMVSFYLIRDAIDEPFLAVLFVTDVLICAINVYALLCVLSQYQDYKMGAVEDNVVQPRDPEAAAERPQRPLVTTTASFTDDVNSSNAPPSMTLDKLGAGPSTTPKFMHCELTTISEELNSGTPTTPKELCVTSFIASPTAKKPSNGLAENQVSEI
ncbi:hypothetical protein HNY73_011200 [Argiope bruennichi]|uniref:Uncharacterized protein n=2 Tax=Argiope bruennichi TaxID=94029 RepID=A0A8T0F3E3_ARGBR|nr:hypothetical protein HNY73_011200 [Argiope bruennichi]